MRAGVQRKIYANDGFPLLTAAVYGGLALAVTGGRPRRSTLAAAAVVAAGCVAFSKPKRQDGKPKKPGSKPSKWGALRPGLAHASAHLAATATTVGILRRLTRTWPEPARRATVVALGAVAGATVGPAVFARYLLRADRLGLFGRNTNELFAATGIEGHKGFLRLHVQADGDIRIYPVKVDKIARWEATDTVGGPRYTTKTPLTPTLVEAPITVTRTP